MPRSACLGIAFVLFSCWVPGCATIVTTERIVDTPIRAYTDRVVAPDWSYRAEATTTLVPTTEPGTAAVPTLRIQAIRFHRVAVTEQHVVHRTVMTERAGEPTPTADRGSLLTSEIIGYGLGGVGAILLTTGMVGHYSSDIPWTEDPDGSGTMYDPEGTWPLWTLIVGAALTPVALIGIVNDARAIDSEEDRGEVTVSGETREEQTDEEPAAGEQVQVASVDGAVVAEGVLDVNGVFEVPMETVLQTISGTASLRVTQFADVPDYEVRIAGQVVGSASAVTQAHQVMLARFRSDAQQRVEGEWRATSEEESRSGRCSQSRYDRLEQLGEQVGMFLDGMSDPDVGYFRIIASEVMPATATGAEVTFDVAWGGQFHVLMVGLDQAELAVQDANGYDVITMSSLANILRMGLGIGADIPFDTRSFRANALDEMKFRVTGRGCAAIIVIEEN